jgi:hypothetical protein
MVETGGASSFWGVMKMAITTTTPRRKRIINTD